MGDDSAKKKTLSGPLNNTKHKIHEDTVQGQAQRNDGHNQCFLMKTRKYIPRQSNKPMK